MGRPKKTKMLDGVLAVIRERGSISETSLGSYFPTWQPATFKLIIQGAIDAGLITRGAGGGGGVLRLTALADESPSEQDEDSFIAALEQKLQDGGGVRKSDLCALLNWPQPKFDSVYANLLGQERILAKRGGWLVLLADEEDAQSAGTQPSQPPAPKPAVSTSEDLGKTSESNSVTWAQVPQDDLDRLRSEIKQKGTSTNQQIRDALGWTTYRFWRTRTMLALEGSVVAEFGDSKLLKFRNKGDSFGNNELETLSAAALRFACKQPDDELNITVLSVKLGQGEEKAVCVCQNLIYRKFVKPLKGGSLVLSPLISRSVTASAGKLEVLRALGDAEIIAKNVLFARLPGWTEEVFNNAVRDCDEEGLIGVDSDAGIIIVKSGAKEYVSAHKDDEGGSICLSPADFDDLRKEFEHDDVVMFIGAGASAEADLPSWSMLLEKTFAECQGMDPRRSEEIKHLLKTDLLSAASAIEASLGTADFNESLRRCLDRNRCNYPSTSLLIALCAISASSVGKNRVVLTTNLDELIDHALHRAPSKGLVSQPANDKIHHIHGALTDSASWVMTRAQYNKLYHNDAAYYDALNGLFSTRTIMFVGYGMHDYEINLILDRMEGTYSGNTPKHFFFIEADEASRRPFFISRLKKLGMRPVYFRGYNNLPFLLLKLAG